MREKFNHLYLDSHERKLLIHSLVELKNQLIQQGRYTDCVDELVFKVINAPTKRTQKSRLLLKSIRISGFEICLRHIQFSFSWSVHL